MGRVKTKMGVNPPPQTGIFHEERDFRSDNGCHCWWNGG